MTDINRRDFVRAGVMAGVTAGATVESVLAQAPAVKSSSARPVVIASGNGNLFKNGGDRTCVEEAFRLLVSGSDPLDAAVAGVNIVERDPEDTSVGFGGLPNADGVVQLDSCCMHGLKKRAGIEPCSAAFLRVEIVRRIDSSLPFVSARKTALRTVSSSRCSRAARMREVLLPNFEQERKRLGEERFITARSTASTSTLCAQRN